MAKDETSSLFKRLIAGVFTLTLCAMGRCATDVVGQALSQVFPSSSVLPLAWAFSVTGVVVGFSMLLIVAAANTYTCDILLHAARITGARDYEGLAFAVGGKPFRATVEAFVLLLLYGSMVGTLVQLAEICDFTLKAHAPHLPSWMLVQQGAIPMAILVLLVVLPLCMLPSLESLEYAGIAGTCIVGTLVIIVAHSSLEQGLPAVRSGDFPIFGISDAGAACGAVSVFGFAFFLQPFIMPLLSEMPPGRTGVVITSWAMRITLLGTALGTYALLGFFAAARYGSSTRGNILQNEWLDSVAGFVLNASMVVYLAISAPCMEVAMRHTLLSWLTPSESSSVPPHHHASHWKRHLLLASGILGSAGAMAAAFPSNSASILIITSAVGVCAVSYVLPITIHLALYCGVAKCQVEAAARQLPSARYFQLHGCWNGNNPVGKPLGRLLRRLSSLNSESEDVEGGGSPGSPPGPSIAAPRPIQGRRVDLPSDSGSGSLRGALSLLLHTMSLSATPPLAAMAANVGLRSALLDETSGGPTSPRTSSFTASPPRRPPAAAAPSMLASPSRAALPPQLLSPFGEGRFQVEDETFCLLDEPYCKRSNFVFTLVLDLLLPLAVAGVGCFASVAALADLANGGQAARG